MLPSHAPHAAITRPALPPAADAALLAKPYEHCGSAGGGCASVEGATCVDRAWAGCAPDAAGAYFACERKDQWYWQCKPGSAQPAPGTARWVSAGSQGGLSMCWGQHRSLPSSSISTQGLVMRCDVS
jgi:hypothetical protein